MKTLFESSFTRDTEVAKDIYKHIFFKRPFSMVLDILLLGIFVINLSACIVTKVWDNVLYLIIVPVFFIYQVYSYHRAVKNMVKQEKDLNNGQHISVVVSADEEGIVQTVCTGKESKLPYGEIKKVFSTKKLFLIQSTDNLLYTVKKDAFTKGTAEEFAGFLREKGVKVK